MVGEQLKDFSSNSQNIKNFVVANKFEELFKYTNISSQVLGSWLIYKKCDSSLFFNNEPLFNHFINNANDLNNSIDIIKCACRCLNLKIIKELSCLRKTPFTTDEILSFAIYTILHNNIDNLNLKKNDDPRVHEILIFFFTSKISNYDGTNCRKLLYYAVVYATDSVINIILDFMELIDCCYKTLFMNYNGYSLESLLISRDMYIKIDTIKRLKKLGCEFSFAKWYFFHPLSLFVD